MYEQQIQVDTVAARLPAATACYRMWGAQGAWLALGWVLGLLS